MFKKVFNTVKNSAKAFLADDCANLAAGLAYYAIFSLIPLVVLALIVATLYFSADDVIKQFSQATPATKDLIKTTAESFKKAKGTGSIIGSIVSIAVLIFSSSGVFATVEVALCRAFGVQKKGSFIKAQLQAFAMVGLLVLTVIASIVLTVVLGMLQTMSSSLFNAIPGGTILWQIINIVISLAFLALVFAALYRYIPNCDVRWTDVWIPGIAVSVVFGLGAQLFALYVSNLGTFSAYGALSAPLALLTWIYYSNMILLFGAELANEISMEREIKEYGKVMRAIYPGEKYLASLGREGKPEPEGSKTAVQAKESTSLMEPSVGEIQKRNPGLQTRPLPTTKYARVLLAAGGVALVTNYLSRLAKRD